MESLRQGPPDYQLLLFRSCYFLMSERPQVPELVFAPPYSPIIISSQPNRIVKHNDEQRHPCSGGIRTKRQTDACLRLRVQVITSPSVLRL